MGAWLKAARPPRSRKPVDAQRPILLNCKRSAFPCGGGERPTSRTFASFILKFDSAQSYFIATIRSRKRVGRGSRRVEEMAIAPASARVVGILDGFALIPPLCCARVMNRMKKGEKR